MIKGNRLFDLTNTIRQNGSDVENNSNQKSKSSINSKSDVMGENT
jgi:hypothetical protein